MTDNNSQQMISRRRMIRATGAAGIVGVAGCIGGDDDSSGDAENPDEVTDEDMDPSEYETLEVGHWWTAGGEQDAINALMAGFEEAHPDVEYQMAPAPGGAGSALEQEVKSRVVDGNPHSTFQIWPGKTLQTYTEEDLLFDLGDGVWTDEVSDAYLDGPKKAARAGRDDGAYVAVPINIHRLNNLFYNVSVVEDAGVDPASIESPSDLLNAMETIDSAGYIGMAHQTSGQWSTHQLWAQVLLGESGADTYDDVMSGNVSDNEDAIRNSLDLVTQYREYFNEDASSVSWDEANNNVINGDAAFLHQGDWAAGQYLSADGFEFESDWDYVPFPGTDNMYALNMDSFVFPVNNPSPNATVTFLQYAATEDAQIRFNKHKGSIPPRSGVDTSEFGPFQQRQIEHFENSEEQPPSVAHGLALHPRQRQDVEGVFSAFIEDWDVDSAYQGLVNALE
jgi:glucose/mannose transport system substrate-binding protein